MKKHDWFAATLFQPELTTEDFFNAGIIPNNTEIKSRDYYKSLPSVVEKFTVDNKFNEKAFNQTYDNALLSFNKYSTDEFDKLVLNEYEYDPAEWRAPIGSKIKNIDSYFQLGNKNLQETSYGIENLGLSTTKDWSIRELAQKNTVRDENGSDLGWTPNERGGLFKSLTNPTLILATYDKDVIDETGKIIHHEGDIKLDDHNMPFYEELGDREIYGKDVLHISDTLTEDGSKWNRYDFFDSDGVEKSIGGTLMKSLANIAPYFIPGFNYVYAGMRAGLEMAKVIPTFSKAAVGIFGGNDNDISKELSEWEGYLSRFNSSMSDDGRNSWISIETLGSLVSDITGQLYQQRAVSMIPALLQKAGFLKGQMNNIKLGQELAFGYMAATSARESYSTFKNAGASDAMAGLALFANALALNGLMRSNYLRQSLFKGSFLDDTIKKDVADRVAAGINKATMNGSGAHILENLTQAYKRSWTEVLKDYKGAMLAEAIEETMEEGVLDVSKGLIEALDALGLPVSDSSLNFNWNTKDILGRYAMSFFAGGLGGGIFHANHEWNIKQQSDLVKEMDNSDLAQMTYMIAENKTDQLKDYYRKLWKKGKLGDPNLSGSNFQTVVDIDGENKTIAETEGKSQNDIVYEALMQHIDYVDGLLSSEGLKIPTSELLKIHSAIQIKGTPENQRLFNAQVLNTTAIVGGFLDELNHLSTQIVKKRAELDSLIDVKSDKEKRESNNIPDNKNADLKLEELKELRKKRDDILSGKYSGYYISRGAFALDEGTHSQFVDMTINKFTESIYNKKYSELDEAEKIRIDEDYEDYKNTAYKRNIYRAYDIYNKLSERWAPWFAEIDNALKNSTEDLIHAPKLNIAELFDKINERINLKSEYDTLSGRELNSEEENIKNDLEQKIENLDIEITKLSSSTDSLLRGSVENEIKINNGEGIASTAKYISSLYDKYIENKTFVRSEDELNSFYRALSKAHIGISPSSIAKQDMEQNYYDFATIYPNSFANFDADNDDGGIFGDNNSKIQNQILERVKTLENAFTNRNIEPELNELFSFIKTHSSLNDNQIDELIRSWFTITYQDLVKDSDTGLLISKRIVFDRIKFWKEIEEKRSKLVFSPIFNLLKEFETEFSSNTISDLLQTEMYNLTSKEKITDYIIGNEKTTEDLKKSVKFLSAIRAIINGSYSGLNALSNGVRTNKEIQLAEISEHSGKLLINDIVQLQNKINYLLKINELNGAGKLRIHQETEIAIEPKFIARLIDPDFVDKFNETFGFNLEELWNASSNNIDLKSISESNWSSFKDAVIKFESKIYDKLKEREQNESIDKVGLLVSLFKSDLYKSPSTRIEPDTQSISSYDLCMRLLDIFTIKSSDFYSRYRNMLEVNEFQPVIGQEMAIRRNVCFTSDINSYNAVLDSFVHNAKSNNSKYIQNKKALYNTSVVFGGAGTGKTMVIAGIGAQMLAFNDDVEFVFIAPNDTQVEKLAKAVNHSGEKYSADKFFEKYLKTKTDDFIYNNDTESREYSLEFNSESIFTKQTNRRVIIVDEATLFNVVKWDALSQLAKRENAVIWALGDIKQNQAQDLTYTISNGKKSNEKSLEFTGIEDFHTIKSPLLTSSLRSGNIAQFINANTLDLLLSSVIFDAQEQNATSIQDYERILKQKNSSFELKYYDVDDVFVGTKFISDNSQASMYLKRFAVIPGATVAYISDNENAIVPEGVTKINANFAQGGEYDYVVIDHVWDSKWSFNALRDLYTLSQRAVKGAVIVDHKIQSTLNIKSKSDKSSTNQFILDDSELARFKAFKLSGFANISVADDGFKDYFKINKIQTTSEERSNDIITQNNSEVLSEPPKSFKPENDKEFYDNKEEIVDNVNESDYIEEVQNDYIQESYPRLNISDYYIKLFNNSFIKSFIPKDIDISVEDYRNFTKIIGGAILYNKDNWKNAISVSTKNQQLLKFLNNQSTGMNIVIEEYNDLNDIIVAEFTSGKEVVKIPIGFKSVGLKGVYDGDFKLEKNGFFIKGEHKSITEVSKIPGLNILDNWGVVSINYNDIKNSKHYNDKTKSFIKQNNGKVFVLITDNPYLYELYNNQDFAWDYGEAKDGTKWLFKNSEWFRLAGVMKHRNLIDIVTFVKKLKGWQNSENNDISFIQQELDESNLPDKKSWSGWARRNYQIINLQTWNKLSLECCELAKQGKYNKEFTHSIRNTFANQTDSRRYWLKLVDNEQSEYKLKMKEGNIVLFKIHNGKEKEIKNWGQDAFNFKEVLSTINNNISNFMFGCNYTNSKGEFKNPEISINDNIYSLFNAFTNSDLSGISNLISNSFKHSVFANMHAGGFYNESQGSSGIRKYNRNDKSAFVTDASNWQYSSYYMPGEIKPREVVESKQNQIDNTEAYISEISELLSDYDFSKFKNLTVSKEGLVKLINEDLSNVGIKDRPGYCWHVYIDHQNGSFAIIATQNLDLYLRTHDINYDEIVWDNDWQTCASMIILVNSQYKIIEHNYNSNKPDIKIFKSATEFLDMWKTFYAIDMFSGLDDYADDVWDYLLSTFSSNVHSKPVSNEVLQIINMNPELESKLEKYLSARLINEEC